MIRCRSARRMARNAASRCSSSVRAARRGGPRGRTFRPFPCPSVSLTGERLLLGEPMPDSARGPRSRAHLASRRQCAIVVPHPPHFCQDAITRAMFALTEVVQEYPRRIHDVAATR